MRAKSQAPPETQCRNKIQYISRARAKHTIKELRAKGHHPHLAFYQCPHCSYFHLGNKPKVSAS